MTCDSTTFFLIFQSVSVAKTVNVDRSVTGILGYMSDRVGLQQLKDIRKSVIQPT